jgi:hypothetical protein
MLRHLFFGEEAFAFRTPRIEKFCEVLLPIVAVVISFSVAVMTQWDHIMW